MDQTRENQESRQYSLIFELNKQTFLCDTKSLEDISFQNLLVLGENDIHISTKQLKISS